MGRALVLNSINSGDTYVQPLSPPPLSHTFNKWMNESLTPFHLYEDDIRVGAA